MQCLNCNKKVDANWKFCPSCGEEIEDVRGQYIEKGIKAKKINCWSCNKKIKIEKSLNSCSFCGAELRISEQEVRLAKKSFPESRNRGLAWRLAKEKAE